jgi:uncharacterized protein
MKTFVAWVAGVVFGAGLLLSGMLDPGKVQGFLDVAGAWNPQLAFVMGGAILVATPAFIYVRRSGRSLLAQPVDLPDRSTIDARLLGGAAIFGVGWGLAGICPGPAIVLAGFAGRQAWIFLVALAVGALAPHLSFGRRTGADADQYELLLE